MGAIATMVARAPLGKGMAKPCLLAMSSVGRWKCWVFVGAQRVELNIWVKLGPCNWLANPEIARCAESFLPL